MEHEIAKSIDSDKIWLKHDKTAGDIQKETTDIIIPIYNAYDDLVVCLNSLYKNTDLTKNRLILINDNSPDPRIKTYLDKQAGENIIVIHNDTNKGFSNNINIGMSQSDHNDVILLNSDTIVTHNWVEKLRQCAYREASTGTVTPLSNNASLCSVPDAFEENVLPEYLSVEKAGEIVERCSLKKYPRISVANGFCMYIKREVIDLIGNFDAETFGRGYGEENDFCNRAEQVGYHHVMCDDTYIYHSGTKSFISKEKENYIKLHDEILRNRYPKQMRKNDIYVRDNPNYFIGKNVGLYFDLANGKKNILYLVQSDFRKGATDNVGGTQFHVRDLTTELKDRYNIFVAARDGDSLNLTVYHGKKERFFQFPIGPKQDFYQFRDPVLEYLWRQILSAFKISLIHVHHTISTSFDIFYVAAEYRIPVIFTAHDYYFICPGVKLLDDNGKVCIGKDTEEKCKDCLHSLCGITNQFNYIKLWRENCQTVLNQCGQIIVPDQSAAEIFSLYYPSIKGKIKVIEHGYSHFVSALEKSACSIDVICCYERLIPDGFSYRCEGWAYLQGRSDASMDFYLNIKNKSGMEELVPAAVKERPDVVNRAIKNKVGFECMIPTIFLDGNTLEITVVIKYDDVLYYAQNKFETPRLEQAARSALNVAFIGGINKEKGGREICSIIESLKDHVNWHVFGGIGLKELESLKQNNLIKTGYYTPDDLPVLLRQHQIDVIGILSIWPETYSYTLTEALMNGIPVIVTEVGALARRTQALKCGWVVSTEAAPKEFISIIKSILRDDKELNKYRETLHSLILKTSKEMADATSALYEKNFSDTARYDEADYRKILTGHRDPGVVRKAEGEDFGFELGQRCENAEKELAEIKSSAFYQIARKVWKIRFPGMQFLKRVILKLN